MVEASLCSVLALSFVLQMYPVFQFIENNTKDIEVMANSWIIGRLACVFLLMAIAINVPSMSIVASIIGGVCFSVIGFVLPGMCHLVLKKEKCTTSDILLDMLLVCVGVGGAVLNVYDTFT